MAFKFANQGDKPLFTSNGIPFMFGTGDLTTLPDSDGEATFIQEDTDTDINGSKFGRAIAVGFNRIVVGAPKYDTLNRKGAVFVYNLDGDFLTKIEESFVRDGGDFGDQVTLLNARNNIPQGAGSLVNFFDKNRPISDFEGNQSQQPNHGDPVLLVSATNDDGSSLSNGEGWAYKYKLNGERYQSSDFDTMIPHGAGSIRNFRNVGAYDGYVVNGSHSALLFQGDTEPSFYNRLQIRQINLRTGSSSNGSGGTSDVTANLYPPGTGDGFYANDAGYMTEAEFGGGGAGYNPSDEDTADAYGFIKDQYGFDLGAPECGLAIGYNKVYVGAPKATGGGAVFVYDLDGRYQTMIKPQSTNQFTPVDFGTQIKLHAGRIIVSAPGTNGPSKTGATNNGAFYIFDLNGRELKAVRPPPRANSNSAFISGMKFGQRNQLAAGCGRIVIAGSDGGSGNPGIIHVYNIDGEYLTTYTRPVGFNNVSAGVAVAIGSGRLVIGDYIKSGDLDGTSVEMGRISIHKTPDVMTVFEYRDRKLGRA